MEYITKVKTNDGVEHSSVKEAEKHLNNLLGIIINKHAHKLARLNKYADVCEYLQENLLSFVEPIQLLTELNTGLTEDNED